MKGNSVMNGLTFLDSIGRALIDFESEVQRIVSAESLAKLSDRYKKRTDRATLTEINGPILTLKEMLIQRGKDSILVDKAIQHPGERELSKNRRKKLSYCYSYSFFPKKLKNKSNRKSPIRESELPSKESKEGVRLTIVTTPQVMLIPPRTEAKREEQEIRKKIVSSYRESCSKQAASRKISQENDIQFKELINKRKKPVSLEFSDWKQSAIDRQRVRKRNHLTYGMRVFGAMAQAQFSDLYEMIGVQSDSSDEATKEESRAESE